MPNKPTYVPLRAIYEETLGDTDLCTGVVESFVIEGLQGYFISYEDIIKIAPELLPTEKPVLMDSEHFYEDIEIFEPRFDSIILLNKVAQIDKEMQKCNSFWIYETGSEEYWHYITKTKELLSALQSGLLEASYYDFDLSEMKPISPGLWYSEHREILWKQGKVLLKGKYIECLVTSESSEAFLATLPASHIGIKSIFDENAHRHNQTNFEIIKIFFADEKTFINKISKVNIENIKDSLSFRIFKLALICDSLGFRKTTTETLADFIYHTQDWYFEGTQKTISLAKKAASMIRSIDAAKGGVALDLRRYDSKNKKII